jgi:hypothetical protein
MRRLLAPLLLVSLAACSKTATITVTVDDLDTIAVVEVIDKAVWFGDVPNDAGFTAYEEGPTLPVTFEVPPGTYVVNAGQGTGSGSEEVTVEAGDKVDVALSITFVE